MNPARQLVGKLVDIVEEGEQPPNDIEQQPTPPVGDLDKPKKIRKPRFAIESEQSADDSSSFSEHLVGNGPESQKRTKAEVFIFDYGVCVIWGMTEEQEKRFLSSLRKYEVERMASDDIEVEDLVYYYASYSRYVACASPLLPCFVY